jgi:hypothetical protein
MRLLLRDAKVGKSGNGSSVSSLESWSVRLQNSRLPIRAISALAVWGFLSLGGANAGTCVNRQDGTDTVQSCDNGSGGFMAHRMRGLSAIRGRASGRS